MFLEKEEKIVLSLWLDQKKEKLATAAGVALIEQKVYRESHGRQSLFSLFLPFCDADETCSGNSRLSDPCLSSSWNLEGYSAADFEPRKKIVNLLQLHIISTTRCFSTAIRLFLGVTPRARCYCHRHSAFKCFHWRHPSSSTPRCSYPPSTQLAPGILFVLQGIITHLGSSIP